MAETLGIIDAIWRGDRLDIEKGGKCKIGGYKQNAVPTSRRNNYSREYEGSEITVTSTFARGQSLVELFAGGQGELQVQCDTGQTYIFNDAFLMNRPEFTADGGGKVEMKWGASEPEELLNG